MKFDINDPEVRERFMAAYGVVRRARERRLLREAEQQGKTMAIKVDLNNPEVRAALLRVYDIVDEHRVERLAREAQERAEESEQRRCET